MGEQVPSLPRVRKRFDLGGMETFAQGAQTAGRTPFQLIPAYYERFGSEHLLARRFIDDASLVCGTAGRLRA